MLFRAVRLLLRVRIFDAMPQYGFDNIQQLVITVAHNPKWLIMLAGKERVVVVLSCFSCTSGIKETGKGLYGFYITS